MKKSLIVISIVCIVAVLAFAACSTPTNEASPSPTAAATETPVPTEAPTEAPTQAPTEAPTATVAPTDATATVSGSWTDPLTGDTLKLNDGNFTLTGSDGTGIAEGTYKATQGENQYDVTYADGSTGSFVVKDTVIEFTNTDTGTVTVYESSAVE